MYNDLPDVSYLSSPHHLLMASESLITAIKKAIRAKKPHNIADLNTKLNRLSDALDVLRVQVNHLIEQQAEAVAKFSEGEDLAQELVDELEELAERKTAIRPSEIKTIADELCSTADDLCFLLSSGVNP